MFLTMENNQQHTLQPTLDDIRVKLLTRLHNAIHRRSWFWIDDEESVIQEVLIRYSEHKRSGKFQWRDENSLWAYLTRTLFFVVMELKDKIGAPTVALDEARDFKLSHFRHNLAEDFAHNDCLHRLYDTIGRMKDSYRQILELTLAGMKTGAIAQIVNKPPERVAVSKWRALQSLGKGLKESGWLSECGDEFALEVGP